MTLLSRFAGRCVAIAAAGLIAVAAFGTTVQPAQAGAVDKAAVEKIVHDYLLAHPEILLEMSRALQAKQEAEDSKARSDALKQVGLAALLDPKVSYSQGPANAKVTVVEFFDYRCPHCKTSLPAVKALLQKNPNVRFAFVEYPILTADSMVAAQAAIAARRQSGPKYVAFHLALMAANGDLPRERILDIARGVGLDVAKLQRDMQDAQTAASIRSAHDIAEKLHLDGTPSFVVNNKVVVGELSEAELTALVKAAGS